MITYPSKPVTVLYLGSLTHSDETSFLDKTKPHEDEIDFQSAVKITLIRIPRPGKDIYSRHISITQNQTIKNFEIYFRNLQKTSGRFSLLTSNNEFLVSSTDDILITPKQPIFTDLLLIKGNFTKITLCIYGNLVTDDQTLSLKCPNYLNNAAIEPIIQNLIQIKKDVFEQKREVIRQLQSEIQNENSIQQWHEAVHDDGINQQQIENICDLSQKLLNSFETQQLTQQPFVVEFRTGLEQVSANLAKIFKNKHLGLYYPSFEESNVSNDLSLSVTTLALKSLQLSLSEKVRGLEILKFMLQLDRHYDFFVQNHGIQKLIEIFVDFFKINTVVLSTYKNLILQVLICVSHWPKAALKMTEIIKDPYYHEIFQQKTSQKDKISQQRQRSRQKKTKKSRSDSQSQSSEDDSKKKKKDKQKKRNRSKEKKKGKQSKSKQELLKKIEEQKEEPKTISFKQQFSTMSFYEVLLFQLSKQRNSKQLLLIKILLQQILQTITKSKVVSERVSLSTSLLKDIKYIFNPAGEVLNTKSLKQFASCYQPFLNNVQSEGVEGELISERQKLKNMKKYGINPKICKIINKISLQIASSQCNENEEETKTPFDSSFIVMMSELIRSKQRSVLYGFGRMLTSFKVGSSNDIIYLKKIEAAMTMISQYIYKILVEDQGLYTVLNIDHIYTSLINITNCLSKDPTAFTKQLKRKIRQLTNYAMAYDLFNRSEGNFKSISDSFLRLFKFEHYEINKISDFKKKQFDKLNAPFSPTNLTEAINLGSFHELFPQQPLLQIDVYLKIFNIILQYNKNVWPLFYENKLVCGFSVLYSKLSNIVIFLVNSSPQRQSILINLKKPQITVENHLNVMYRLMKILTKKAQYESAFNDLIDEDNFENVEMYEKSFELYIALFNAVNENSSLLSAQSKNLAEQLLSMIMQIYDKLMESYELTSHISRQSKLRQLWSQINKTHFLNLKSRAACLSLFAFMIQSMQNATIKLFNATCIEQNVKVDCDHSIKGYLPTNEKSIVQNLILANIFRGDPLIQNNLFLLVKNLVEKQSEKNPTIEKITSFLENVFDEIDLSIKQKGNNFQTKKDLIPLEKMVLLTDLLRKLNCVLTVKFEQKLLKHLKFIDSIRLPNDQDSLMLFTLKNAQKIKSNIILFLKKSLSQKSQHPQILNFIQLLAKNLEFSAKLSKTIQNREVFNLSQEQVLVEKENLNLISSSLQVVCACSSNPYYQSVILYEVFLQKPYKPVPQLSLFNLFNKLSNPQFVKFITSKESIEEEGSKQPESNETRNIEMLRRLLKEILIKLTYFLCLLSTIDSIEFYSTESRRNAIICMLSDEKEFPFNKFQQLRAVIPQQFLQTLKDYYSYPIVQKPLILRSDQKKEVLKNKGYMFSKALFTIIMEGQLTAKSRYQFIGGPWKGGDITSNVLYTPIKQKQYSKIVSKCLKPSTLIEDFQLKYFSNKTKISNEEKVEPQLIEINTKKRNRLVEKKPTVDTQIKLLYIPLVLENTSPISKGQQSAMLKKVSPSPSNKFSNVGYSKGNQPYDGKARLSPSPPSSKIPSQNIIGFNSMNQTPGQFMGQAFTSPIQPSSQQLSMSFQQIPPQMSMPGSMQGVQTMSPSKSFQYGDQQGQNLPPNIQTPTYPNPYYGLNPAQKQAQTRIQPGTTLPYLQMQKTGSQQTTGGTIPMRSGSSSAPRSNPPYGGVNYQQQPYYGNVPSYPDQGPQKMSSYDGRSHSPYQKQYPTNPNQPYGHGQRMQYPQSSYYPPQGQNMPGYGGGYGQMPRQSGYPSMGNRPYNPNNPQYNYDYQGRSQPLGVQGYPPNYQAQNYGYNSEEQRLFNEAILLVTELRGTLPQHLKTDKKNRLNQILHSNIRVQNRVKQYINNLK